jgi:threonine/homoserine/homoserine lactone efflux protein
LRAACVPYLLHTMSFDTFIAVLVFSIVMGFTPGPNNVMLASSGATHGVRRTWPHLMGVALGFPAMILVIGLGLASILLASSKLQLGMKVISCVYLLWLAIQIGRSRSVGGSAAKGRPLTFLQAAAFQWVNPKAWLIAVGAISAYTAGVGAHLYLQVAIIAAISVAVTFSSCLTWAACGAAIGRWLRSPLALRLFNLLMAALLLASVVPILGEIWTELHR